MTSISAADPFDNDGMEWIRLSVEGQSFMLHQIRKMVSCASASRKIGTVNYSTFVSRLSSRWLPDRAHAGYVSGGRRK